MSETTRNERGFTKVTLETYPGRRLSISAEDERGYGHGYRIHGPKFGLGKLEPTLKHDLDTRDVTEIRVYLRVADEIQDPGWPQAVHELTAALDRWKGHTQGAVNHHASGEPQARERLLAAAKELMRVLAWPSDLAAFQCDDCGHRHTSANFGHICIGCPCPVGQPPAEEYPDVSGGGVPYPPVSEPASPTPSEQDSAGTP